MAKIKKPEGLLAQISRKLEAPEIRAAMKLSNRPLNQVQRTTFLLIVAKYAHRAEAGGWRKPMKRVTPRHIQGVIKHAKGLRQAVDWGVVDNALAPLLDRTIDALKLHRSKGGRGRSPARQFLDDLAMELLRDCDWCSPTGLMHLAELMAVPCNDDKMAQRICNEARENQTAIEKIQASLRKLAAKYPGDK